MGKCLITKLSGVVYNTNLIRVNESRFIFTNNESTEQSISFDLNQDAVIESNTEVTIDIISTVIQYFSNTRNYQVSANIIEPYYYIALPDEVILSKVTTENNEQIKDDFIFKGNFTLNSIKYKLYEFHLNSGLSLDASVTINVTN